jgi:phosphoglycolate phosphatase
MVSKKRSISLLVYDFDGTLVDTLEDIAWSVNRVLQNLQLQTLPVDTVRGFVGKGVVPLMSRSIVAAGGGEGDMDCAVDLFKSFYSGHLLKQTCFYPNCRETIEAFSEKIQAILSNKPSAFIEQILTGLNFRQPFQAIVGGDTYLSKKPDPEGLLNLIEKFQIDPSNVLLVGDSAVDVETGKRAGVMTVAVSYGFCDPRSNKDFAPDCVIDDLAQLQELIQ